MSEIYSVSYTNHASDRTVSVKKMLENNAFVDVTLVCADDQLEAHKVLLSAASPFFNKILQRNPHSHPLLYLRGSLKKDVSAILDFIYSGETQVLEEDLESFMALAGDLEIEGLVDEIKQKEVGESSSIPNQNNLPKTKTAEVIELADDFVNPVIDGKPKLKSKMSQKNRKREEAVSEDIVLDQALDFKLNYLKYIEEKPRLKSKRSQKNSVIALDEDASILSIQDSVDIEDIFATKEESVNQHEYILSELDEKVNALVFRNADGLWSCSECVYQSKAKHHVKEHVETHIEGYSHPCLACGKAFTKRVGLRQHTMGCRKKLNKTM